SAGRWPSRPMPGCPWPLAPSCRSPLPCGMVRPRTATGKNWSPSGTTCTWNSPLSLGVRIRPMNRRDFLHSVLASGSAGLLASRLWAFDAVRVDNPLGLYPARDWEKVYRDQYRYDGTFTWVCAPNDTHMCRLRAFVRNGVVLRSEQNYDHDRCGDL